MGAFHEFAKRHNAYVAKLTQNVVEALDQVEEDITDLNKSQLLKSRDSGGKPLFNVKTRSTLLSPAYAKRTGKLTPNLKYKGDFQKDMFTDFREDGQYFTQSSDRKQIFLNAMYRNIFGISPQNIPLAKRITTKAIALHYKQQVYDKAGR